VSDAETRSTDATFNSRHNSSSLFAPCFARIWRKASSMSASRKRSNKYQFPYEVAHKAQEEIREQYWSGSRWLFGERLPNFLPLQATNTGDPELTRVLLILTEAFGQDLLVYVKPNRSQLEPESSSSSIQSSSSAKTTLGELKAISSPTISMKTGASSFKNIWREESIESPGNTSSRDM